METPNGRALIPQKDPTPRFVETANSGTLGGWVGIVGDPKASKAPKATGWRPDSGLVLGSVRVSRVQLRSAKLTGHLKMDPLKGTVRFHVSFFRSVGDGRWPWEGSQKADTFGNQNR